LTVASKQEFSSARWAILDSLDALHADCDLSASCNTLNLQQLHACADLQLETAKLRLYDTRSQIRELNEQRGELQKELDSVSLHL
jgi:hypothetical protein